MNIPLTLKISFWSNVQTSEPSECWLWRPSTGDPPSYGHVHLPGGTHRQEIRAHRLSYAIHNELSLEELRREIYIRHTCDNPRCVNPAHLIPGTIQENLQDMRDRMRHQHGETHFFAKLTEANVADIKALLRDRPDVTQTTMSQMFGVSLATINDIKMGKTWKHVTARPPADLVPPQESEVDP